MTSRQASQFTFGLMLVVIGLIFLSGELTGHAAMRHLWPVVFLVIGVGHLVRTDESGRLGTGLWFLFLGGVLLLHSYDILSLRQSWPLFIVAVGASTMFGSSEKGCTGKRFAGDAQERRP